jgi:hypothetical protein
VPPNAASTCAGGTCGYACLAGFADCDGISTNGCELDVRADRANCGACMNACGPGLVCAGGVCSGAGAMVQLASEKYDAPPL